MTNSKQELLRAVEVAAEEWNINADEVSRMELAENANGEPVARLWLSGDNGDMTDWPLTDAEHVHVFNEFLKTLNLGVDVKFENFTQYAKLLTRCAWIINERNNKITLPQVEVSKLHIALGNWSGQTNEASTLLSAVYHLTEREKLMEHEIQQLDAVIHVVSRLLCDIEEDIDARANILAAMF